MSQKTLEHGQITGLRCPHCPLVAQRDKPSSTALTGLEAHMRVVHPEYYEAWVSAFRGTTPELGEE